MPRWSTRPGTTRPLSGPRSQSRWGELTFEAAWRDRAEQTRARDLVRRLHLYLRRFDDAGGTLIGAEPHFEVEIPLDDLPLADAPRKDGAPPPPRSTA